MVAVGTRMTIEEFLQLPEEKPALEFEDGEVTRKVSPKGKHSSLQGDIVEMVNRQVRAARIGRAFTELRVTFGRRSRVPDAVIFRWDRIPRDPSGPVADDIFSAPDVVFEVVSPKQSATRLVRRCLWFVQNGVHAAVLVDPREESMILFRPDVPDMALERGDLLDLSDIIPTLTLSVSDLFDGMWT